MPGSIRYRSPARRCSRAAMSTARAGRRLRSRFRNRSKCLEKRWGAKRKRPRNRSRGRDRNDAGKLLGGLAADFVPDLSKIGLLEAEEADHHADRRDADRVIEPN